MSAECNMSGAFALLLFPEISDCFHENLNGVCIVNVHLHGFTQHTG